MRSVLKMPSPQGAAAGQTATINIPVGWTYHQLMIYMEEGDTAANTPVAVADWGSNINEIRVLINGDAKIRVTAADLVKLHQFYALPLVAGVLPITFSKPHRRTIAGEDATAWGTLGLQSVTLEIEIAAGIDLDALTVYGVVSDGTQPDAIYTLRRYNKNIGATGEIDISEIRRGPYAIHAIHIASAAIDNIEVEADQVKVLEQTPAIANAYYQQTGRAIQSGWTHIDFGVTDRLSDGVNMRLQDFRVKANFTAQGINPAVYTENVENMALAA